MIKKQEQICTTRYDSPLGMLTLACAEKGLIGLWMDGQKYYAASCKTLNWQEDDSHTILRQTRGWLDRYFSCQCPSPDELPLLPGGTSFRQEVWKLLCRIPYGQTVTYGWIAVQMAEKPGVSRMSARAVGGAVGHNPISIIIPCHRVIGADGRLTGYAGGIEKKKWLLEHEQGTKRT